MAILWYFRGLLPWSDFPSVQCVCTQVEWEDSKEWEYRQRFQELRQKERGGQVRRFR